MTVKELADHLRTLPPDWMVTVWDYGLREPLELIGPREPDDPNGHTIMCMLGEDEPCECADMELIPSPPQDCQLGLGYTITSEEILAGKMPTL